jgi:exonuclease SbcC
MIIQRLELENFKSYGETQTIDISGVDALSISGPNGAGKSSLIEALTFALYARSTATERKELGNEAIIRDGQDEARVAVTFEKDNQTYRVERTATRKGVGKATLTQGSGKALQAGPSRVSKMIESIIGMDYDTFVSSTIMRQDEMDRITSLRPGERKEILSKIFGLELYEKLKKATHEKHVAAKTEIETSTDLIERLTEAIANENETQTELRQAETAVERLQKEIISQQRALQSLEEEIKTARAKKTEYDKAQTALEGLEREIKTAKGNYQETTSDIKLAKQAQEALAELEAQIQKGKQLEQEKERTQKLRDDLRTSITEQEERMRSIKKAIAEEQEHYNTIKASSKAECPVCKQPLDTQHKAKVLEQYDVKLEEIEAEYQKSSTAAQQQKAKLENEIGPKFDELEKQVKAHQRLEVTRAKYETTASRLPKLLETERELKVTITKATEAKQSAAAKVEVLSKIAQEYEGLEERKTELTDKVTELREEKASAESSIKHLSDQLEQITKAKKQLEQVKSELGAKREALPIYEILEDAFGKDGIPTAILKDLVPEVEDEASTILRDLSNGRMNIKFQFGRPIRSGTQSDELIVEAEDSAGFHPVTRFSGGEKMRINLALRLGISDVIARRSGYKGKIETLIIDEGLGALDEEGRQATIEILRQLRQRFKKILVISHVEDVRDAFDTKLVVSKNVQGQSMVEIS